jgi:hypothetical protein
MSLDEMRKEAVRRGKLFRKENPDSSVFDTRLYLDITEILGDEPESLREELTELWWKGYES